LFDLKDRTVLLRVTNFTDATLETTQTLVEVILCTPLLPEFEKPLKTLACFVCLSVWCCDVEKVRVPDQFVTQPLQLKSNPQFS
jgi:hypothetical protein